MIIDLTNGALDELRQWSQDNGLVSQLSETLEYLGTYACLEDKRKTMCNLYRDFADHSLAFDMLRVANGMEKTYKFWFNGGMIYNDCTKTWSVHT